MIVALNGTWKAPIAYFLTDGLSGPGKANITKKALEFIHESGVVIANLAMTTELGANLNHPTNLKTWIWN